MGRQFERAVARSALTFFPLLQPHDLFDRSGVNAEVTAAFGVETSAYHDPTGLDLRLAGDVEPEGILRRAVIRKFVIPVVLMVIRPTFLDKRALGFAPRSRRALASSGRLCHVVRSPILKLC